MNCSCPERDTTGQPVVLNPQCRVHGLPDGKPYPPMDRHARDIDLGPAPFGGRVVRKETPAEVQARLYMEAVAKAPPRQRLYRCSACGKWSHAKKRPPYHVRVVVDDRADPEVGVAAATHEERCGPFVTYIANPVTV